MSKDKDKEQKEDLFMLRVRSRLGGVRQKFKTRDKLSKVKDKNRKAMKALERLKDSTNDVS